MKKKIFPKKVYRLIHKLRYHYEVLKAGPVKIQVDFGGKY